MSFQNNQGGFGGKASSNVEKDFAKNAADNINKIKKKGQEIAKENEKTINTAKKTAIGCSAITLVGGIATTVLIIYIIYKIFS